MYRSALSASRSRRPPTIRTDSVNLLHQGLQRKVSQTDYLSIYPHMKPSRINHTPLQYQYSEEQLRDQVGRMRQEGHQAEEQNRQLRTLIRREHKLNALFQKRKQDCQLRSLPLHKLQELQLILQTEELEQLLQDTEQRWKEAQQQHRHQKDSIASHLALSKERYWATMVLQGIDLQEVRVQKQGLLAHLCEQMFKIRNASRKLKQAAKSKEDALTEVEESIAKQKKALPSNFGPSLKVTDSGGLSLQSRTKTIEEIETEIKGLQKEHSQLQLETQREVDYYVREKLVLLREIDQLSHSLPQTTAQKKQGVVW